MSSKVYYDYTKLIRRIKDVLRTQGNLARRIGLNKDTISRKINCIRRFTQDDIRLICIALNINKSEIPEYFFTEVGGK